MLQMEEKPMRWILIPDVTHPRARSVQNADIGGFHADRNACIDGFCYYVMVLENMAYLCRLFHAKDVVADPEVLDHESFGITGDDLSNAVLFDSGDYMVPGPHPITPLIETKLRALYG